MSIHWKNWSPSGVPLAAYRLKRSKHHEEIIPFTDAERVAGADAGTVPDLFAERIVSFVATWAILATVICVVAGGVGVYATEYVLERYGRELPPESLVVKIVTSLFCSRCRGADGRRLWW